ncbi:hypothetical protein ETI06_03925 [Macrococcoides goetzii]|nr:hypothetical protein [Macrococcus goetzii]TDM39656.1 hypothetical protein ETI10_09430 [Macrococcus goetzii]TDM46136.1 hypothetical protein ETI08_05520 [Macrococcus goetzii]TDM49623.1 hypothetical protein ETI06_03925 [Macrococcus goetzii]
MDFELGRIHKILVALIDHPDADYYGYFKEDDIIIILLEMGLVEFKFNVLIDDNVFKTLLKIEVTKKGLLFMTAYNNQVKY